MKSAAAKILKGAIRKLKRRGIAEGVLMDENGAYCMVGAIYSAAGASDYVLIQSSTNAGTTVPFDFQSEEGPGAVRAALKAVERVVRRVEFGGSRYRGIYGSRKSLGLARFGDDYPSRVIPALKQALIEVEQ